MLRIKKVVTRPNDYRKKLDMSVTRIEAGLRIRKERKRIGLTQEEFGALGGAQRLAQGQYEKGVREPRLSYLISLAAASVDIIFIITGKRRIEAYLDDPKRRTSELSAMAMVEDYVRTLPEQKLSSSERFALFDAFRRQSDK